MFSRSIAFLRSKTLRRFGTGAIVSSVLFVPLWAASQKDPSKVKHGLIESIGHTPLIELQSLSRATGCRILAKAEHLNPGGSVKDRPAKFMVLEAEHQGQLTPGKPGVIVEGTGGNTGVGLALVAAARGYGCILVMPNCISPEKIHLMELLGAQVVLQPAVPFSDPQHYFHTAARIAKSTPNAVFTNQFENLSNFASHYTTTAPEIWSQTAAQVDGICASSGTGGTIAGLSCFLKEKNPHLKAYLIDPPGSGLFSYLKNGTFETKGSSIAEGIGIARLTANFAQAKIDGCFEGLDQEAVDMAYYLMKNEGLWVGPSAALNVVGAVKLARILGHGKVVVTVLCDGGDRYRTTLYDQKFLAEKNLLPRPASHSDHTLSWIS